MLLCLPTTLSVTKTDLHDRRASGLWGLVPFWVCVPEADANGIPSLILAKAQERRFMILAVLLSQTMRSDTRNQCGQGQHRLQDLRSGWQQESWEKCHSFTAQPLGILPQDYAVPADDKRARRNWHSQSSFCSQETLQNPYSSPLNPSNFMEVSLPPWVQVYVSGAKKELPLSSPEGNNEIKVVYFWELHARENGEIWYKD